MPDESRFEVLICVRLLCHGENCEIGARKNLAGLFLTTFPVTNLDFPYLTWHSIDFVTVSQNAGVVACFGGKRRAYSLVVVFENWGRSF